MNARLGQGYRGSMELIEIEWEDHRRSGCTSSVSRISPQRHGDASDAESPIRMGVGA